MSENKSDTPNLRLELKNRNLFLLILLFLSLVLFFSNLWIGDLGLDSCSYATISRSIVRTNDWTVLHYEHCKEYQDFWVHPPLFFWMTAISFKIFGVNEFAARFISALLGALTVLLVYIIGYKASHSYRIGFLSGLILLTTQPFLELGRKCQLDLPLSFFITLSILFLILAIQKSELYYILLGISTGLAFLAKGLPAASIVGIVFLYFIVNKEFKFFISAKPYIFLLFTVLTLCIWLIPLIASGQFKNFIHHYFVGKVWVSLTYSQGTQNVSFFGKLLDYFWYINVLAKKYWPWLPFLLFSYYFGFKKIRENKLLWIFFFWGIILLFGFSLAGAKFYRYIAPTYPSFALLIGLVVGARVTEKLFKGILKFSVIFLLVVLFATSIFPLYFGKINAPDRTEIKKMTPYIQAVTEHREPISVYQMNYWGAVATFAFYVDRSIQKFDTEDSFALSLKEGKIFGYIKKEDYNNLSAVFREKYLPIAKSENFFLLTNVQNHNRLKNKMFPINIY